MCFLFFEIIKVNFPFFNTIIENNSTFLRVVFISDNKLLKVRHSAGNTHDHARTCPTTPIDAPDEVPQHFLRDREVRDHPVPQWADCGDAAGSAVEQLLCFGPDGVNGSGPRIDRDDARLREYDSVSSNIDERVRSAEVDGHVADPEAGQVREKAHR